MQNEEFCFELSLWSLENLDGCDQKSVGLHLAVRSGMEIRTWSYSYTGSIKNSKYKGGGVICKE